MKTISLKKMKSYALDFLFFILGSAIYAASVNIFTAPNNIAPGGLTGIGTMLNYLFDLPIGTMILALNIPLFILGLLFYGKRFLVKTVVATAISSVVIDLTANYMPQYHGEPLLTVVFGGLLSGLGLALILMRGGTTGGTELAANLASIKFPHISIGKLIMALDILVVLASVWVYGDFESPLYAFIVIFITSKVIDSVLYGTSMGTGKMMFIISPQYQDIANVILSEMERGVTALKSRGGYSGIEGEVLLCAVRRQEVYSIYHIVHAIDPDAFIIVSDAGEISGEGFNTISEPVKKKISIRKKRKNRNK